MEGAETALPAFTTSGIFARSRWYVPPPCRLYGSWGGCLLHSRADDAGLPSTRFPMGASVLGRGLVASRTSNGEATSLSPLPVMTEAIGGLETIWVATGRPI